MNKKKVTNQNPRLQSRIDIQKPIPSVHDSDLRLLRIFMAVVRNGGFSAAQTELNISQSSISESIGALEVRFGVNLCDRGRSGFRMTQHGVDLHDAAHSLFQDIENFQNRIGEFRNEISGRIFLGIVDGIATIENLSLTRALEVLNIEAPAVDLELRVDSPQSLISGVQNGRYDVAVLPIFRKIPGIASIAINPPVKQSLYCGIGHPMFGLADSAITNEALESTSFAARKHMEGRPYPGKVKYSERAWTNDMECLATLILTGRFIAYLPVPFARLWVNEGSMRILRSKDLSYSANLFLITRVGDCSNATKFLCNCLSSANKIAVAEK